MPSNLRASSNFLSCFLVLCTVVGFSGSVLAAEPAEYATSEACRECHSEIYGQWKLTTHANMLRDARKDSSAILADQFTEEIPFTPEDIDFVLGSHWIQKYLTRIEGELYILPRFWNISEAQWEPYSIWNWRNRPYSRHCNWCHSVGYDPKTKTYAEASIGCEACHGAGRKHAETASPEDIVNPARLPKMQADMVCEGCHTDGKDRQTKTYPFPAGYEPGKDLREYYTDFFMPKPGAKGWYQGEATYQERHRMFLYWQSKFYSTTRSCEVCEFERRISTVQERQMTRSEYCGTCHRDIMKDFEAHAKHSPEDVGCAECHVPTVNSAGQRYNIHDHKFDFSGPEIPCTECHGQEVSAVEGDQPHNFNFDRVQIRENLTLEQACERCHTDGQVTLR